MTAPPRTAAQPVRSRRRGSTADVSLGLTVVLVGLVAFSGTVGTVDVSILDASRIVVGHLLPGMPWMDDGSLTPLQDQAVWQFRIPRTLLAALAGASLALAGTVMQATVRNPLAEPYILGVSAGAGVGAVLVITLGSASLAGAPISVAAFAGALVATTAVYLLAR